MSVIRQDAWTNNEDIILAEVVLRYIREGSTQLAAFEEVGAQLQRSSAACGFRWNSLVRKKYSSAVELAKKQRKKLKKKGYNKREIKHNVVHHEDPTITIDDVISYLTQLKLKVLDSEGDSNLKLENERLQRELLELKERYQTVQHDYQSLMDIMSRASKMMVVQEQEASIQGKKRFQKVKNNK
jgi:prespore-specific regulator